MKISHYTEFRMCIGDLCHKLEVNEKTENFFSVYKLTCTCRGVNCIFANFAHKSVFLCWSRGLYLSAFEQIGKNKIWHPLKKRFKLTQEKCRNLISDPKVKWFLLSLMLN